MHRTERRTSIQEIMNQMAGRMDSLLDQHDREADGSALLDEVRMWIAMDPLLAELYKQYLDARAHYARLKEKHGDSDPICDVAADMQDSARCAVDTRIIELRQSEEGKSALQAMIRKVNARREAELVAAGRARSARYAQSFAARKAPRAADRGQTSFFKMMMGIIVLQQLTDEACEHLRIAEAFSRVAGSRRLAASG